MKRLIVSAAVGSLLVGGLGYLLFGPTGKAADAPYRLASLDRGTITANVRATGTLNPVTTVLVGSQLSGQVVEILVDYNSEVKAGQVVARLYGEQIKSRRDAARADLAQAQAESEMRRAQAERARATRRRAEGTLADLKAQRERARAQSAEAQRALERQTSLKASGVGSQTAFDAARTQAEVQKAAVASSEAQIVALEAEMKGLDADIALADAQAQSAEAVILQRRAKLRDIEIDLERTEIKSPVDGVVVRRDIELGQTVAASLNAPTLFLIAQDLRTIDIYANIDEADVGRIQAGQATSFTVNAYPNRTFEGRVKMVRLSAQTLQNVVTYTAVINVANRDRALLPGMTANLQILVDERRDALRVPNAALRFRPPGATPSPAAIPGDLPQRSARPARELRERLAAEVRPTDEQREAIERIMREARDNFPGRQAGIADEERRSAIREARRAMAQQIAAVLDPERRRTFEAIIAEISRGNAARPDAGTPGRIFILGEDGQPKPVPVRLGISDGAVTEIVAGEIPEGAGVIIGGGPKPDPSIANAGESSPAQRRRGPRLF